MKLRHQTIFLLLTLFSSFNTKGQVYNLGFEAYNAQAGLSQNLVFSIVQDKQGFIWFGTDEGLNRFDGNDFKVFRTKDNDPHSLIDNSVHALYVANDSTIWIGTNNGVCRYFPKEEIFVSYPVDDTDSTKLSGTGVSAIREDEKGWIWITYLGSGVDIIIPGKAGVRHYTVHREDEFALKNDYTTALVFLPDGFKILGTRGGIQFLSPEGRVLNEAQSRLKYPWKDRIGLSVKCAWLSAESQSLWIGTELSGLYRVNIKTNEVENYNTANSALAFNNNVPSVLEDSKGNVWVGGEAIYLFDKKNNSLIPYNEFGVRGDVAIKNPILSLFEDKDNNVWLGTFRLGALKYNPLNVKIMHYHMGQGDASLTNNQILSFNQDAHGNVWIGTDGGGLLKMRPNLSGFDKAPLSSTFTSQAIKCIFIDKAGYFWLGTWDGGMIKYHPDLKTVEIFSTEKKNFGSRHVWDIQSDSVGNFWIATLRDGLCYFSPTTKKYSYFKSDPDDSTSLVNDDVMCVFVDSKKNLWVGTANGLSFLRANATKFTNLPSLNVAILNIYEDADQKIWLGTGGKGILILNRDHLRIEKTITEKDGLPSSTICSIQPDNKGNIWASTYNGLVKINSSDLAISEIPEIAGLQGKEFINNANFKTRNGMLLFGGVNGFNFFHPDSIQFSPLHEKIVFTSFKILNDEILPNTSYDDRNILAESITLTHDIALSYKDYSITINFASLCYNWQKSLRYSYFLENFDKDWQYTSSDRRFVHYTNLPPGQYTLKVKSSFDGKHWPATAKELRLYVSSPWWATWWFRSGAGLAFAFVLLSIYKVRVRFLQRQKEKLESLVIIRTDNLKQANAELHVRNSEVEIQKKEIQILLNEVAEQKDDIEEKNHELRQINEELASQRDNLETKGAELERAQGILKQINTNLEGLVDKRTEKLNLTLRELETFLYRASHDLRGPVTTMLGLIHIEKLENQNNENLASSNHYLEKTVQRLERTLQKITQKHTLQKTKVSYELFTWKNLDDLIRSTQREVPSFRASDFELTVDTSISFESDREMLFIIFSNLLENAFYFTQRAVNKKITVEAKSKEDKIYLSVLDHGPGVKKEIKDKIFTMFFRGNENSGGNGLGLYLVKGALDKLDGHITLETEEGVYTKLTITFDVLSARKNKTTS